MNYTISGVTSFIGLELSKFLIEHGNEVYGICRESSPSLHNIPKEVHVIYANMAEYGKLHERISSSDVFIHLAWGGTSHAERNIVDVQKENVINTLNAIESAKKMGCKVFVEAGSQAEYGTIADIITEETPCRPFSEYGKAKLEIKKQAFTLCENIGIKYIHLRIFSIFGETDHPWTLVMNAMGRMLKNAPVDLSSCTQHWNFLYVKDAVSQIVALCTHAIRNEEFQHEVYNLASDDTRPLHDFVEEMKKLTNSSSLLNYGAVIPENVVSLRPDISKLLSATRLSSFTPFDEVIRRIKDTIQY